MPRFTFTQRLESSPSEDSYNQIIEDFQNFINVTKLDKDNLNNQAVRFRHLSGHPTISLFKDCGDDIWNCPADIELQGRPGTSFELFRDQSAEANTNCLVEYTPNSDIVSDGGPIVEFTFWYYPYSINHNSVVCPAVRDISSGNWHAINAYSRYAGIGVGFYTGREQPPYNPDHDDTPGMSTQRAQGTHPFLAYSSLTLFTGDGRLDRLGTVAYGGPIICTMGLSNQSLVDSIGLKLTDIDGYGMMIKHDRSEDDESNPQVFGRAIRTSKCSRFDRLYLHLVARGN